MTSDTPEKLLEELREAKCALAELVSVVDAAGTLNLSRGVPLGPTVWYVKAEDAMNRARQTLSQTGGGE